MDIESACYKAEEIAKKYNGDGVVPFPFDKILKEEPSLRISYTEKLPDNVSGVIIYNKDTAGDKFLIAINKAKSINRKYFTIAHELGHYYLHREYLEKQEIIIDDGETGLTPALFRVDESEKLSEIEREANNFAASLLMPSKLVIDAWNDIRDIQECAKIFQVSVIAMTIRLERLHLIN